MRRIFITAFEPYGSWPENASWLAMVEFTRNMLPDWSVTTRLYPVDFAEVRRRLEQDLAENYDFALHLGQAPGSAQLRLESFGLNIGGDLGSPQELYEPLVAGGPAAYHSALPLGDLVKQLQSRGIPASISYHAGTFLCNATLYLTHYLAEKMELKTQATFLHLPLETSQVIAHPKDTASLPAALSGAAIHTIVESLIKRSPLPGPRLA